VKKVGQNGDWNIPVDFDVNMSRLEWTWRHWLCLYQLWWTGFVSASVYWLVAYLKVVQYWWSTLDDM
jgi:hypothetical protein